jgi:hypothetical protein
MTTAEHLAHASSFSNGFRLLGVKFHCGQSSRDHEKRQDDKLGYQKSCPFLCCNHGMYGLEFQERVQDQDDDIEIKYS